MEGLSLIDVARLEEARAAAGLRHVAPESRPIAGGVMGRGEPGLWCNYAVGVAMDGPIARDEFLGMIAFFEEHGCEARVETSPYAHPSLMDLCAEFGFVLRGFETVLYHEDWPGARAAEVPAGVTIERVRRSDVARLRALGVRTVECFSPAGHVVSAAELEQFVRNAEHPATVIYEAFVDGSSAGIAAMEVAGPVVALFGAATWPGFRRRGVQTALIRQRLLDGAAAGARVATIGSRPGVATERTGRRLGFRVAYTKVALSRPGAGLLSVRG